MTATKQDQNSFTQEEMLRTVILYRLLELKERIPLVMVGADGADYLFIEAPLKQMLREGYLKMGEECYLPTNKAREYMGRLVAQFDQVMKFEIFGNVKLDCKLTEQESENGVDIYNHVYDPRFSPEAKGDDLRLAMMTLLGQVMSEELPGPIDPRRIVFLQKLSTGEFRRRGIWLDIRLGRVMEEIDRIVSSAYRWTSVGNNDEESGEAMEVIYKVGIFEQKKRDGFECGACHVPLAIFMEQARNEGQPFNCCPNPDCGASFEPPRPDGSGLSCPQCNSEIRRRQRKCHGCGALIDYSLPEGTVEERTVAETETVLEPVVFSGSYGYVPYGYYNPLDPFVDAVAFAALCTVLY